MLSARPGVAGRAGVSKKVLPANFEKTISHLAYGVAGDKCVHVRATRLVDTMRITNLEVPKPRFIKQIKH